jgi:hypothetical protein
LNDTIVCIGTGPSLTLEQIDTARQKGFALYGCNKVHEIVPDLQLLYGCNEAFWVHYWDSVKDHPCEKWTTNKAAADKFGLNWIAEKNKTGLSVDSTYIHHGHGSGYSLLNLAYLKGAKRIVLLGYDLKYASDYNGHARQVGSGPRHYFGEYPSELQHWPKVHVEKGIHTVLCDLYQSVADQGLVEIINCTADSALTCFPKMGIENL